MLAGETRFQSLLPMGSVTLDVYTDILILAPTRIFETVGYVQGTIAPQNGVRALGSELYVDSSYH